MTYKNCAQQPNTIQVQVWERHSAEMIYFEAIIDSSYRLVGVNDTFEFVECIKAEKRLTKVKHNSHLNSTYALCSVPMYYWAVATDDK